EFYVLNEGLKPCPVGVSGDLYIGGVGVMRGYWRDETKTRAAIVHHLQLDKRLYRTGDRGRYYADGSIEFLGRMDLQVKVRGFRVELGEVEAALTAHPAVDTGIVVAHGERDKQLFAYYTSTSPVASAELRAHLEAVLPDYMVPAGFI